MIRFRLFLKTMIIWKVIEKHRKQVENSLYAWFLQERKRHTPISGVQKTFSGKWRLVGKFKTFFNWALNSYRGKIIMWCSHSQTIQEKFIIEEMDRSPDQVYNANKSGLFWRLLLKLKSVHCAEVSASGRKMT